MARIPFVTPHDVSEKERPASYALLAYNMNAYELEAPAHAIEPTLPV